MSDTFLKKPLGQSLNEISAKRAEDAIQLLGKALPATITAVNKPGTIVTVKFELGAIPFTLPRVRMPVLTSEYIRAPLAVGCRGFVIPADAYLGGMSGLGGGTATLAQQSNLGALVFAPIGNVDFEEVGATVATVYGPGGVTLRTQDSTVRVLLTQGGVTIIVPGGQVAVTPVGVAITGLTVTVTGGDVIADGISLKTHRHSGVQVGGSNTGVPI
jgi:hypothetical protein